MQAKTLRGPVAAVVAAVATPIVVMGVWLAQDTGPTAKPSPASTTTTTTAPRRRPHVVTTTTTAPPHHVTPSTSGVVPHAPHKAPTRAPKPRPPVTRPSSPTTQGTCVLVVCVRLP